MVTEGQLRVIPGRPVDIKNRGGASDGGRGGKSGPHSFGGAVLTYNAGAGALNMAVDNVRRRVYVTNYGGGTGNTLSIFDLAAGGTLFSLSAPAMNFSFRVTICFPGSK